MDTSTMVTIAGTTISLLVPYLKSVVEGMAKKTGEEIGEGAGEAALNKAKQLYNAVKTKFVSKPNAEQSLTELEASPESREYQTKVQKQLEEIMSSDEDFAKELINLLNEATQAGADTVFNTNIYGSVQKLVEIGNVYGDVNI